MRQILFCFLLSIYYCLGMNAQTKEALMKAKADYKDGNFANALPVFQSEYNNNPADPSLNLWYGVSLFETNGDIKQAEACLLTASKKNIPESYLYLGDLYLKEYRIEEARLFYDKYAKLKPKERATTLKKRYENIDRFHKLISRTENIQIIDSLIVDKSDFLSAYNLSPQSGTLSYYNEIFTSKHSIDATVFTNGIGSKMYFGQTIEGHYILSQMDKLLNGFEDEREISTTNFGLTGDTNYPFVETDGTTLYFAGKDSLGIGGYDIYVTRYNLNSEQYLKPELLNMPFNSTANDYLMVIDEIKGIGWFATDRFQPEGKVCVYTFIPNKEFTLLETADERYKEKRARLTSIKDTYVTGKDYSHLLKTAKERPIETPVDNKQFEFIINDLHTYYYFNDFRNVGALNLFKELQNKKAELKEIENQLNVYRNKYASGSDQEKLSLTNQILKLEKDQEKIYNTIPDMENEVRNEEIKSIK